MSFFDALRSTESDSTSEPPASTLAADELAAVLSNWRRQSVIEAIGEASDDGRVPVDHGDLADAVTESECGPEFSPTDRKRVYVALYQTHIPHLVRDGVLVDEDDRNLYRPGPEFEAVRVAQQRLQRVSIGEAEVSASD